MLATTIGLLVLPTLLAPGEFAAFENGFLPTTDCTGHVGDFVWYDVNGNGLQDLGEPGIGGVLVVLKDEFGNLVDQTYTFPNGRYYVGGWLCAETFTLEVDESTLPPGLVPTLVDVGTDDTIDSDPSPITFTLPDDNHRTVKFDFGYTDPGPCTGAIGDFVWDDLNADGIQDAGEPGLEGVVVNLEDAGGGLLQSTVTDANGLYLFTDLCADTYVVVVDGNTLPPGYVPSLCNVGVDDTLDNDCSPAVVVLLTDDAQDMTIDFGYTLPGGGGEGCTPGYWKQSQHFDSWADGYLPTDLFSEHFEDAFPGMTLLQVLQAGGGGLKALGRHTVAALLNAASPGVSYDLTVGEVTTLFNDLFPASKPEYTDLKDYFEFFNTSGCPLH